MFFLLLLFAQYFKAPTQQTVLAVFLRECKFSEYFRNKRLLGNISIVSGVTETKFAEIWKQKNKLIQNYFAFESKQRKKNVYIVLRNMELLCQAIGTMLSEIS